MLICVECTKKNNGPAKVKSKFTFRNVFLVACIIFIFIGWIVGQRPWQPLDCIS